MLPQGGHRYPSDHRSKMCPTAPKVVKNAEVAGNFDKNEPDVENLNTRTHWM